MNYKWDGCSGEETIIRKMLLGDIDEIRILLRDIGKKKLKEIFLRNNHRFYKENKTFWQLILEVTDEEFKRKAKENFRNTSILRHFI
ncbi:hypothetical protein JYK00_03165 [Thermosipho ferrireducens]|uniref:Uncharacterized protein n=1 Tax=Thermosipho ferrireducens TaxID=2571116 RepID=A0ABX7S7F1_9BACT|nr:hypothetical protein [Thermosipho ferrireducens]QTA38532.1 hypothetical protein JYK00_03165 [Thermosipho ferrireducens]